MTSPLLGETPTARICCEGVPQSLQERDWWVNWAIDEDGRKRPRAPYKEGHSYPVAWNGALPESERPETDYTTVKSWAEMDAATLEQAAELPDECPDETLGAGIILPVDRPPREERITLIDWDDVRDPETGEVIEECAAALRSFGTYAEVSLSGGGIHQFVRGGLEDRGKFIAEIRDVPVFDHNDPPQVEIYDGGRHVACTRQHVEGTPETIVHGQEYIEKLIERYGSGELGQGSPFGEYDLGDPPEERPLCYHAALQARRDPPEHTTNYDVNTYTAMLGLAAGFDIEEILADFAEYKPQYGFDRARTEEHLERLQPKVEKGAAGEGGLYPPSPDTLWQNGILPDPKCNPNCPIQGHGVDSRSDGGVVAMESTDTGLDWELCPRDVIQRAAKDPVCPITLGEERDDTTLRDLRTSELAEFTWELIEQTGREDVLAVIDGPLYKYDDGVWSKDSDGQRLRELAGEALASAYTGNVKKELEERVRMNRAFQADELGAPDGTLAVENGLLNLRDQTTTPLQRDHYAIRKVPTTFEPEANCPRWQEFVERSIPDKEDRHKFQEYAGYLLWHHAQPFGKALFLVGPTDSGKGTALKTLGRVVGEENIANETLRDLIDSRWGTASLYGRMANIRNELQPMGLQNVQEFKELTGGGDRVSAERKGEPKFEFRVTQKFLFSTNEVPSMKNADEAFYNRCLFVRFPNTVPEREKDRKLLDKLVEEQSGILNWMLDGLNRLLDQNGFSGEREVGGKKEICNAFGGVVDRFIHNCLEVTGRDDHIVVKGDMYEFAKAFAEYIDKEPEWSQQNGFTAKLKKEQGIKDGKRRKAGKSSDPDDVFIGVRPEPEAIEELGVDVRWDDGHNDDQERL